MATLLLRTYTTRRDTIKDAGNVHESCTKTWSRQPFPVNETLLICVLEKVE